ncbi:PAS domain-containing protein [Haloferula sp. A504]|uniref:PAS domain-containing protein n=1 Tax=Haloferula sp. A504 TaxID=3373601 RepID=UPI0031C31431|nr:PAS domain-containing protein [Verrucomicrobiaceae bacterium E54]
MSENGELGPSRGELQVLNEKLNSANAQLMEKVDELRWLNKDLHSLLESAGIVAIFLDTGLRIRRLTPTGARLHDIIPPDEGEPISELATRANDPELVDDARSVLETGVPVECEVRNAGGRSVTRRVLPWRAEGTRRRQGVVVTFTDVTPLRKVDHRLEQREQDLRQLTDAIPVLVAEVDRNLTYRYCNARYREWFGLERGEVIGRKLENVLGKEVLGRLEPEIRRVMAGESVCFEADLPYRHGPPRQVRVHYIPRIDHAGEVLGFHAMIEDITERREAEEQLAEATDRLEEKVAERTAVAEEKAADLRLLASQMTNAEQRARRKLARLIHDDLQQLLVAAKMRLPEPDQVPSSGELDSISEILDQVLRKSRMMVSELSPPVLREGSFTDALGWLARWMEEHHRLDVRIRFEGDLDEMGENLRTLLFCSVRELLFNAAKHAGGSPAWVSVSRKGGSLLLEVEDEGKGFDPAEIRKQSDGFGLFNTRERIEAFGGSMEIESAPGEGARFRIRAPLVSSEPRADERFTADNSRKTRGRRRSMPSGGVLRVLLADDHQMVREGIARLLSADSRMDVVAEASNGEEAIELTRRLRPHVVIMDISMPRLNGIEATRQIAEKMPEVVIIGLSLHDRAELGEVMIEAGASHFLKKDADAGGLIKTILDSFDGGESG